MQIIDNDKFLDEDIFNQYIEMVGKEKYQKIIQMFIDDINARIANIVLSYDNNDNETLTREIHTLKSVSYTIGGNKLGNISKSLEEKSINKGITKSELDEYKEIVERFLKIINDKR